LRPIRWRLKNKIGFYSIAGRGTTRLYIAKKLDTIYGVIYNTTCDIIMAQWDKLLNKIKSLDKDMRFAELKKTLQSYGYTVAQLK